MSIALCIVIILVIVWVLSQTSANKSTLYKQHCSDIDDRCYPIVAKFDTDTFDGATDLLAHLNLFSLSVIKHMRNKYLWHDHPDKYRTKMARNILRHYDPDAIIENNPSGSVNTSYVEDKGKILAICLREKISGTNRLHKQHELEFVVLHELAHLTNMTPDHGDEFWKDFKVLTHEAAEIGIHNPVNYYINPFNYCSVHVDYNPYYDKTIKI